MQQKVIVEPGERSDWIPCDAGSTLQVQLAPGASYSAEASILEPDEDFQSSLVVRESTTSDTLALGHNRYVRVGASGARVRFVVAS